MQKTLITIAKQAYLERVLFTPAQKSLYFELAMGSGGASQFKHIEGIRSGMSYAAGKAKEDRQVLLVCAAHELAFIADQMMQFARNLTHTVIVAVHTERPEGETPLGSPWAYGLMGWAVFQTCTPQELYDHLALAYALRHQEDVPIPCLVHYTPAAASDSEITPNESLDLGNPTTEWGKAPAKKGLDFDAALAAVKQKQEKPTLGGTYPKVQPALRAIYDTLAYACPPQGLPLEGVPVNDDWAVITSLPPAEPRPNWIRLLCQRPLDAQGLIHALQTVRKVAVVESAPPPGVTVPPFFAEISGALRARRSIEVIGTTVETPCVSLPDDIAVAVEEQLAQAGPETKSVPVFAL